MRNSSTSFFSAHAYSPLARFVAGGRHLPGQRRKKCQPATAESGERSSGAPDGLKPNVARALTLIINSSATSACDRERRRPASLPTGGRRPRKNRCFRSAEHGKIAEENPDLPFVMIRDLLIADHKKIVGE